MSRSLDCASKHSLMLGTVTCLTAGTDLAMLVDIPLEQIHFLVFDYYRFISAELANSRTPAKSTALGPSP